MASQSPLRILVVGGGVVGGLVGGWLSSQNGVDVTVVERVAKDDHANAGNGLNVGPNGLQLLASVWPSKVAELRAASLPWTQWLARMADGSIAYEIPLSTVSQEPGIRIRWSELYRLVRSSALERLRFETTVVSLESGGEGGTIAVTMELAEGDFRTADFDLIIAADGRYSRVRELLAGTPETHQLGIANFRTLLDDEGSIRLDDMEQWFNGSARIIAFRLSDGLVYISGNLPLKGGATISDEMKCKSYLHNAYTTGSGPIDPRFARLIDGFCSPASVHHWARAQQIDTRWSDLDGRVLYLGDASHAMAPTLGQGATQAMEDAAAFMRLFELWRGEGDDARVTRLTSAFARLRSERIGFVRRFSEEASDVLQLGSDAASCLLAKRQPAYGEGLRRLYSEMPLSPDLYYRALND